ncbi:P-loop containing nucleoside triphosphate hydrolase protein, partial [Roridomyces roridus]
LPAPPRIFQGRGDETQQLVQMLSGKSPRVAILGAGGIGKTSLAKVVLHHPNIAGQHEHRFFVPCDSATTAIELAAVVGAHLGLNPKPNLTHTVISNLSGRTTSLLILDNLDTTWESMASRQDVEDFLALLDNVETLSLLITLRGAERPGRINWTRPFLPPLQPLTTEAAMDMFMDIADDVHAPEEVEQLLRFTDNLPLAVDLMAHLVDSDGCSNVLASLEQEKTNILSLGYDRRSNLDVSIGISLNSPRIAAIPHALDLLRILSILPDGLSDVELLHIKFPIPGVLSCQGVLLSTSLAYLDERNRLKALVPI